MLTSENTTADPELLRLAARIRRLREERGQTMDDLAEASGLSKAYLSRIESADRQPSVGAMFAVARAWGISSATLFEEERERGTVRVLREASVDWKGDASGVGLIRVGSGMIEGTYSERTRDDGHGGINPEEMVGAAEAGCFTMKLAGLLTHAGFPPVRISTQASLRGEHAPDGFRITRIELRTTTVAPGLSEAALKEHASRAKRTCTVSRALTGLDIIVEATLGE